MQDDIADGTRWAIVQGSADPKRICIAGASYGGYATLMGLVKDPDLYKCGVNWVGVSDINLMYNDSWTYRSDMTDDWRKYGMPVRIGEKVKDAAQLKATSPIEQAARINQPLLMAYGGNDVRVPSTTASNFWRRYSAPTRTSNGSNTRRKATPGNCRKPGSISGAASKNSSSGTSAGNSGPDLR